MTKFLAFGDLHYGFDKRVSPQGQMVVKPVHDARAFHAMLNFARDYKPDVVLLMGDQFDMRPVSRHEIDGKPKLVQGQRLKEVYDKGYKFFMEPLIKLPGGPEIHWFDGNHEAWSYQLVQRFPGIDGMVDPYSYMELRRNKVVFHPQGQLFKLGKLTFAHGDGLVNGGKYVAAKAVERVGSSVRIWHFHTYQAHTKETLKNMAYQTGVAVPCLCNRAPHYEVTHLNSWVHGFDYGIVEKNGNFDDSVAIIWHGKFTIDGVPYSGGKKC